MGPRLQTKQPELGSGCGSVGRAVASYVRGPQFESSHWQNFILNMGLVLSLVKTKVKKEKQPVMTNLSQTLEFGMA